MAADLVVSTTASAPSPTQGVLKFTNTFSTTRNKYLRMNSDNTLTMINSAFSAVLSTWDDSGNYDITGAFKVNGTQVVGARGAAVADASGGATIDAEARTAINTLLARLRTHGLIAT